MTLFSELFSNRLFAGAVRVCCFVAILYLCKLASDAFDRSIPEYDKSENAIENNPLILEQFGHISSLNNLKYVLNTRDAQRWGYFKFDVHGSIRDGILLIQWSNRTGDFVPEEIDQIMPDNSSTVLWKNH